MRLTIRLLRETDGHWIGDVPKASGRERDATREEATVKAKALAFRVIAEEIEHREMGPPAGTLQFSIAA